MDHEKYQISIERDGRMVPVGSISGESFSAEQTRRFFEGLLPEGFTRRSVAQLLHLENRGRSFCFRPHVSALRKYSSAP